MKKDRAIEEIRKVRHMISKQFNNDTKSILEHYKELESKYGNRILKDREEDTKKTKTQGITRHCT